MNIRWRLGIVFFQLIILAIATTYATGEPYSAATWFTAGIFSVIISSQILEPFYPRPADVIGNTVICFLLYLTTPKIMAQFAWNSFFILIVILFILAVFSSLFGTGKTRGKFTNLAKVAKNISTEATAVRVYSVVFWLSLFESYPKLEEPMWEMGVAWAILVAIGLVDWQKSWEILTGKIKECEIEGMIAPSRVIVSASDLPNPGSWITLKNKSFKTNGVVISRIRRMDDVWGQVYIESQEDCETLFQSRSATYEIFIQTKEDVLGIADEGSSQENLNFFPSRQLEIGNVVSVQNGETEILYQIHTARIHKLEVKGGSLLQTQANAKQLGVFDINELRVKQYYWAPNPGTAVSISNLKLSIDEKKIPSSWMLIGHILGTELPIYFDVNTATEGHVAILGMTKMGKTTFALRLLEELAKHKIVTILDQTGEYRSRRGIQPYTTTHDTSQPNIAVLEPQTKHPADTAFEYMESVMKLARKEYESKSTKPRVILMEEAHQFIPEPSGLNFGAPGRDSAIKSSSLIMQIRKYGICTILISQRTAVVAKSALSQCENIIAFKSVDKTGLDYLDTIAGHELRDMLPTLKQGEAVVFGPAFSCDVPVAIKIIQKQQTEKQPVISNQEMAEISLPSEIPDDDIPF